MADNPLKIQQLRYVVTAVESGGFKAAAERLNRTQPAISLGIRELESRFGQPLFEKQGQGRLTPFGAQCLPRFRELLAQHDRVAAGLDDLANQRSGTVSLATVPSIARRYMPKVLNQFLTSHPNVEVSLHDGPAELVAELVQSGQVDFGVSSLWGPIPDVDFEPLLEDQIGVVCHNTHPLALAKQLRWQELKDQSMIRNGTSRLLEGTPAASLLEGSRVYITEMISLVAMLETGTSYTTLPRLAFEEDYSSLSFIPLLEPAVARSVGILRQRAVSATPIALEVMTLLKNALRVYMAPN